MKSIKTTSTVINMYVNNVNINIYTKIVKKNHWRIHHVSVKILITTIHVIRSYYGDMARAFTNTYIGIFERNSTAMSKILFGITNKI